MGKITRSERFVVALSESLLAESHSKASIKGLSLSEYARWGIACLKNATDCGFRANHTALRSGEDTVPIPMLFTPRGETLSARAQISLPAIQRQELYDYASQAGISDGERLRRSLRFGNFIVEHVSNEHPLFEHEGGLIQFVGL